MIHIVINTKYNTCKDVKQERSKKNLLGYNLMKNTKKKTFPYFFLLFAIHNDGNTSIIYIRQHVHNLCVHESLFSVIEGISFVLFALFRFFCASFFRICFLFHFHLVFCSFQQKLRKEKKNIHSSISQLLGWLTMRLYLDGWFIVYLALHFLYNNKIIFLRDGRLFVVCSFLSHVSKYICIR